MKFQIDPYVEMKQAPNETWEATTTMQLKLKLVGLLRNSSLASFYLKIAIFDEATNNVYSTSATRWQTKNCLKKHTQPRLSYQI